MHHSPGTELAILFPPSNGYHGADTTIQDLSGYFKYRGFPSKWLAVHLVIKTSFERAEAYGKGMNARRRAAKNHHLIF